MPTFRGSFQKRTFMIEACLLKIYETEFIDMQASEIMIKRKKKL